MDHHRRPIEIVAAAPPGSALLPDDLNSGLGAQSLDFFLVVALFQPDPVRVLAVTPIFISVVWLPLPGVKLLLLNGPELFRGTARIGRLVARPAQISSKKNDAYCNEDGFYLQQKVIFSV